jgi:hypothetical protein
MPKSNPLQVPLSLWPIKSIQLRPFDQFRFKIPLVTTFKLLGCRIRLLACQTNLAIIALAVVVRLSHTLCLTTSGCTAIVLAAVRPLLQLSVPNPLVSILRLIVPHTTLTRVAVVA